MIPFALISGPFVSITPTPPSFIEIWSYTSSTNYATNVDVNSSDQSYWIGFFDQNGGNQPIIILSPTGVISSTISTTFEPVGTNVLRFDTSDNLYVCGATNGSLGAMLLTKFDSSNVQQWTATYSSSYVAGSSLSLAISGGDVFISGGRITGASGTYSVRKFNSSGVLQSSYDSSSNITGLCVDSNYLYMSQGSTVRRTNLTFGSASTFTGADNAYWVDVDNSENIFISEVKFTAPAGQFIRKRNSSGTSLWRTQVSTGVTSQLQRNLVVDRVNSRVFYSLGTNVIILDTNGVITGTVSVGGEAYALKYKDNELYVSAGNQFKKYSV